MEGRGQGETVDFPPSPVVRRRLSKSRLLAENSTDPFNNPVNSMNTLPSTIHVSSIGVEGDVDNVTVRCIAASSSFKSKIKRAAYVCIGMVAILSSVGLILDYYDIWDPCTVKIPYQKQCTVDSFMGGLFQRTELTEDSLCLVPGVFHTAQNSGWNMDCNQDMTTATTIVDQPVQA